MCSKDWQTLPNNRIFLLVVVFLAMCYNKFEIDKHAPVAQLDRVADFESVGRGFEPLRARHLPFTARINSNQLRTC